MQQDQDNATPAPVDVMPPLIADAAPTQPATPTQTATWPLYLGLIALICAIGAGMLSLYAWNDQRNLSHQIEQTIMALRDLDTSLKGELNKGLKEIRTEQQVLRDVTQEIRHTLTRSHDYTVASEAEYLMRIAMHRLQLERDITSAIAALEEADQRLQQIDDPVLFETRQQLINEITALKLIPQADMTGASITLRSLESQIEQFALPNLTHTSSDTTQPDKEKGFWNVAWHELKSLIVVRRTDQTTPPLAQPEQRFFLRQNLRLTLETAQLALLRRDNSAFRANITTAHNWLGRYFEQNAATQGAQASLAKLKNINLTPALPDTTRSLKSLQAWLARNRTTLSLPPTLPTAHQPTAPITPQDSSGVTQP